MCDGVAFFCAKDRARDSLRQANLMWKDCFKGYEEITPLSVQIWQSAIIRFFSPVLVIPVQPLIDCHDHGGHRICNPLGLGLTLVKSFQFLTNQPIQHVGQCQHQPLDITGIDNWRLFLTLLVGRGECLKALNDGLIHKAHQRCVFDCERAAQVLKSGSKLMDQGVLCQADQGLEQMEGFDYGSENGHCHTVVVGVHTVFESL